MKRLSIVLCTIISIVLLLTGCSNKAADIDIDLSELSSTLIQAEYVRIFSNPEDYIGKTIKLYGSYSNQRIDSSSYVHFIIILPGDDCCVIGIEFKLDDSYSFPEDYPALNSMILITGTIDTYERNDNTYIYIAVNDFTVP